MKKLFKNFTILTLLLIAFSTITSCKKEIKGCTDSNSINYNAKATQNDGSCIAKVYGCMDHTALNYNSGANVDNGTCQYAVIPPKTYTVIYTANCIGQPTTPFVIFYVKNGTTYSQIVVLPSGQVSNNWTTSFTGTAGDFVSMTCTPPQASGGYTNSAYLKITYNGTTLIDVFADWPNTADAHGTLPN